MDLNTIYLTALIQQAKKLPDDALPHLGDLAHLGLWLSRESRRRFYRGIAGIFGDGSADHKKGIKQFLRIRELDHEMRADAAREANRLRRIMADLFDRAAIRKFFWALRQATILRSYYQLLLDPTEAKGEEVIQTIFDGTAFREGGLVSRLIGEKAAAAPRGQPGRRRSTADIEAFVVNLKDQEKTWKEVRTAAKERFGDRIKSVSQLRKMYERYRKKHRQGNL